MATLVNHLKNTSEAVSHETIERLRDTTDVYSMLPMATSETQNSIFSEQPKTWDTLIMTLEDIIEQTVSIQIQS
jgi:hypothetical protein